MSNIYKRLLKPSSLILIAANATPLLGVFYWGWDAFLLLLLYWMETAIVGFWVAMQMNLGPQATSAGTKRTSRYAFFAVLGLLLFFTAHAGIFMFVHFQFLWGLFAGDWPRRIHGPMEFFSLIVIGQGLWVPLLMLFIARGIAALLALFGPKRIAGWEPEPEVPVDKDNPLANGGPIMGFYARIVVMQIAIIFGGFVAMMIGANAVLAVLIFVKTAIDLGLFLNTDTINAKLSEAAAKSARS